MDIKETALMAKYKKVIEELEEKGLHFILAQKNHIDKHYRLMESHSSVFVLKDGYRLYLCDEDGERMKKELGLDYKPNYRNKAKKELDPARPFTFDIKDDETLDKCVEVLLKNPLNRKSYFE